MAVLFPGDLDEQGLFACKAFDAGDRETNARNAGVRVGPSRPTIHGLAVKYAHVTNIELRRVEGMLVEADFSLGAIVEYYAADSADGMGLPQGQCEQG
ncbi:MAG: hypothetical protein KJZ87_03565 [Thermoguttaceae bacterium]|nr:hypothetical protein [Thermoguttaceae bacterium]